MKIRMILAAAVTSLINFLKSWIGWLLGLRIDDFEPGDGWPGTILAINGNGFSTNRDANSVSVGGAAAVVLEAEAKRLVILAGKATVTGPIVVKVGSNIAASAGNFVVKPYPTATDLDQTGAPVFYDGPQYGTPKTNVQNQKVQVIIAYPTDQDPGSAAQRLTTRNDIIGRFDSAKVYWNQASYGSTTWDMNYSDWVAMPQNRRFYFWESGDVEDARRELLRQTSRALTFNGTTVACAVSGGWRTLNHPNAGTLTPLSGVINPDGSVVTALKQSGSTLFVGTDAGGLFIYDIINPAAPALRGGVNFAARSVWGIDLSGTTVVVALRDGGLGLVNVANTAAPAITLAGATMSNWAGAVRVVGNRVYAGLGDTLRIFDIVGAALNPVATSAAGAWITGIDADGTAVVVSTDGNGTRVFETNAGGVLVRSTYLGVTRVRAVRVSGNRAYLAANDGGLIILDLTDLAAPAKLGDLMLTKPAYGLGIGGNEAIVAGAVDVVAVDITNPSSPSVTATEAGTTGEPNLSTLRDALSTADDMQALVKNWDRLFIDTLNAYFASTGTSVADLSGVEGVILVINGGFLRGQSTLSDSFADAGASVNFNNKKGVIYFASGADWGRIAHEIGHWLGMWDIYEEWYADGTLLVGTAQNWCLSGNSGIGPLFCGHHMFELMKFYKSGPPGDPNINVVERTWSPSSSLNETFDIVAHDLAQDTAPDRVHLVKLTAASGLHYYLEVRQKPVGQIFDQTPDLPAGDIGRVIVLRVTEGSSISNTFERPIQLVDKLQVGSTFVDAARNLVVTVEAKLQDIPLAYRVRVAWNQPVAGDPNGKFDLTITPWTTDNWETVDIWVDSPRNNSGPMPTYEFHEAGAPEKPILNGDRPWVHRENTIYARVRNTGPQAVPEAWVSCYVNSPPGIGDDGNWALLETKKVSVTGRDPAVPGSGETIVGFKWKPNVGEHTCIKIAILPQIGEIEPNNNSAQENVFTFDSASSSSHEPVLLEAMVRSPFSVWRKVDLRVQGLPAGWHAVIDRSWVWVPAKGSRPVKAVIWTDLGTLAQREKKVPSLALPRVEGWTNFDHRYVPIGGLLAAVKAVKRRKIEIRAEGGGIINVWGKVDPALADVPVTIEVTAPSGKTFISFATTDASGEFRAFVPNNKGKLLPNKYTIQAFITAGADAAEAESNILVVIVN